MMTKHALSALAGLLLLVSGMSPLQAQDADITFFVIGKHATYGQDAAGDVKQVDFSFFAEVFLEADGDVSNGVMTLPTEVDVPFVDYRQAQGGERDNALKIRGKSRYASFAELQADFPDGEYRISFDTPSGSIEAAQLFFRGDFLPAPPHISISQGGSTVCTDIDPEQDLLVSWTPFAQGRVDPNGLLDDLIFVILTNDDGVRVAHSGRPFENKPYLTFTANEFVIPADVIEAGRTYSLSVEHAILDDTRLYGGIPAFTTRAVTTKLALSTGKPEPDSSPKCPAKESQAAD